MNGYYNKYLKYKLKYLDAKLKNKNKTKQIGGADNFDIKNYIVYRTNQQIWDLMGTRHDIANKYFTATGIRIKSKRKTHISLLTFAVNTSLIDNDVFQKEFSNGVTLRSEIVTGNSLKLSSAGLVQLPPAVPKFVAIKYKTKKMEILNITNGLEQAVVDYIRQITTYDYLLKIGYNSRGIVDGSSFYINTSNDFVQKKFHRSIDIVTKKILLQ